MTDREREREREREGGVKSKYSERDTTSEIKCCSSLLIKIKTLETLGS